MCGEVKLFVSSQSKSSLFLLINLIPFKLVCLLIYLFSAVGVKIKTSHLRAVKRKMSHNSLKTDV